MSRRNQGRCKQNSGSASSDWLGPVERLEPRCLLAGTVTGLVQGNTLSLTGDNAANDVVLTSGGDEVQVASGPDLTTISIVGDLSRVRRILWDTGGGSRRCANRRT